MLHQSYLNHLTKNFAMVLLTLSKSLLKQSRRPISVSCLCLGQKCHLTPKGTLALKMVKDLSNEERILLFRTLRLKEEAVEAGTFPSNEISENKPTWSDLKKLALCQSLPFIGFGFLDNFIMIVAGEYIDASIGASLAISTMAAAALGNTLSDVFGVGSAWYVETSARRLGMNPPNLSEEQLESKSARIAVNGGRAFGVMIGCLLGMFPLLFYTSSEKDEDSNENVHDKVSSNK